MIKDVTLMLPPEDAASESRLRESLERQLGKEALDLNDFRVVRRSVDARKRRVMLNLRVRVALGSDSCVPLPQVDQLYPKVQEDAPVIVIVGAGPAGLFAALKAIRLGIRPVVLERGRDVDARRRDLALMSREGKINPVSNYCFGEGGAGAYSDGKLFTRSKKRGSVEEVLQTFVAHGASREILVDAHPHIGSDRLPEVIKRMRLQIQESGGEVRFEALVSDLIVEQGRVCGVLVGEEEVRGNAVILAAGHSARDTFRLLHRRGVELEAKGIAMGVRLEHPQRLIDRIQYHSPDGRGQFLPAAEYSFVTQVSGRGVYSFCMCPGGVVVPAGSADGELVVNGMSASARAGRLANSGMVVEIHPGDFPEFAEEGPLEILALQESLERKMYEASGCSIVAPAQRMLDFVKKRKSTSLPDSSYAPGVWSADFNELLPPPIADRLRRGFEDFGRKSRGFLTNDAMLVGLESRTSAPVRVCRNPESLQSVNMPGLFPAGEGAGYAGGIVSAAIDGIRAVEAASDFIRSES